MGLAPTFKSKLVLGIVSLVIILVTALNATPYMTAATVAYVLLLWGLLYRRIPMIHAPIMISALVVDIVIVLALEVTRSAIETAASFTLTAGQQAHIGASTVALVLYFPVLYLGFKLYRGRGTLVTRRWHVRLALTAFAFRTLGFILMFTLLEHYRSQM